MRRSTKAQIQIGETVAVIFIFIVLLVFGLLWFSKMGADKEQLQLDEQRRLNILEVQKTMMNLPEWQCSIAGKTDPTCLDYYRLIAFRETIDPESRSDIYDENIRSRYKDRFDGYYVYVDIIYPDDYPQTPPTGWQLGIGNPILDFAPENNYNKITRSVPIVIYDALQERRYFGMLLIEQRTQVGI